MFRRVNGETCLEAQTGVLLVPVAAQRSQSQTQAPWPFPLLGRSVDPAGVVTSSRAVLPALSALLALWQHRCDGASAVCQRSQQRSGRPAGTLEEVHAPVRSRKQAVSSASLLQTPPILPAKLGHTPLQVPLHLQPPLAPPRNPQCCRASCSFGALAFGNQAEDRIAALLAT